MTARHLTFFEMLGNFSVGDYFKQGRWSSRSSSPPRPEGFGLDPERIWITVFGGDQELGLGPDEEAIECWRAVGVPDERIVLLGRDDNFWQSGPTGPCGPCSELYSTAVRSSADAEDRPGDDTERFLEYWNLVFMQYELHGDGSLTELPTKNIDTGVGLERMAAILQGVPRSSRPTSSARSSRSGRSCPAAPTATDFPPPAPCASLPTTGAATTFLLADGVVPSNEDRGYILRRIMRRAIQQGRVLGIEGPSCPPVRARDRRDGPGLPRARARARQSSSGPRPRRRASGARSRRASGSWPR